MSVARRAITAVVVAGVAAASGLLPVGAAFADAEPGIDLTGRLIAMADPADGESAWLLLTDEGRLVSLARVPDGAVSGVRIDATAELPADVAESLGVTGTVATDDPEHAEVVDGLAASESPLVLREARLGDAPTASAATVKSHTIDLVMMRPSGSGSFPQALSAYQAEVAAALDFWEAESNGAIPSVTVAWADNTQHFTAASCGDANGILDDAVAYSSDPTGQSFFAGSGKHLLAITPPSCEATGLGTGTVGSSLHEGGAMVVADADEIFAHTIAHEFGHNLGLDHAFVREYADQSVGGDGGAFDDYEYYDLYSVMGFAFDGTSGIPALGPSTREALGFSSASTLRQISLPSGTDSSSVDVTINQGAGSGLTGLKVVDPVGGRVYYVEYRNGTGRDAGSAYADPDLGDSCHTAPSPCDWSYGTGVHITRVGRAPADFGSGVVTFGLSLVTNPAQPSRHELALETGDRFTAVTEGAVVQVISTSTASAVVRVSLTRNPGGFLTTPPVISGTATRGQTLTASISGWSPTPTATSWQWLRNGVAIGGATAATYVPTGLDVGARLSVTATGTAPARPTSATSAQTAVVTTNLAMSRVTGTDRFGTSVEISKRLVPTAPVGGVDTVFIANGLNFPDALAAAPAAIQAGGPVLLVTPNGIPQVVAAELDRLDPQRIVVLGGYPSVDAAVETQLRSWTSDVVRYTGTDRFQTSRNVSQGEFAGGADTVFIVTGLNYPDAMLAAVPAGTTGSPILLVNGGAPSLDAATVAEIQRLGATKAVIVGGLPSVSAGIATDLGNRLSSVVRLTGTDRFGTSVAVSAAYLPTASTSYLATGLNYPDALTGAVLAASTGSPLLLAPGTCVTPGGATEIDRLGSSSATLFGGIPSLSADVFALKVCR